MIPTQYARIFNGIVGNLPKATQLAKYFSSTSSTLFKDVNARNSLSSTPTKSFFSTDPLKFTKEIVTGKLNAYVADLKFADKPIINITSPLKDGREVLVRRLGPKDVDQIVGFHANAKWGIFDSMANDQNRVDAIKSYMFNAANTDCDVLVAIVDGAIVGLAEYEDRPGEMEERIDENMLSELKLSASDVCVSKTMVLEKMQGIGVGAALKKAQLISARDGGFEAIVSRTASQSVINIVKKLGGTVTSDVCPWTCIRIE